MDCQFDETHLADSKGHFPLEPKCLYINVIDFWEEQQKSHPFQGDFRAVFRLFLGRSSAPLFFRLQIK